MVSWTLHLGDGLEEEELDAGHGYTKFYIGESSVKIWMESDEDAVAEGLEKATISLDETNTFGKIVRGDPWEPAIYIEDEGVTEHTLWSSTLTAGYYNWIADVWGYANVEDIDVDGTPEGSLGTTTFDWYGTEYEAKGLFFTKGGNDPANHKIWLVFDKAPPDDLSQTYLQIGDVKLDLERPTSQKRNNFGWRDPGLTLATNDTHTVKLFQRQSPK